MTKTVFVFGSNLAGVHGAGSAREAEENWGAIRGQGVGRQGDAYAIPTKDRSVRYKLPLDAIRAHVAAFLAYAKGRPDIRFKCVAIGCGLAGYKPADIAPMFRGAGSNVELPREFVEILKELE